MAGTSISSQLQAIKTILNASSDPEPGRRRPLTRPSVLFDAKAAADIDLDTIHGIALSGLEGLINSEVRFSNYKNDLFSHQSKELDRELVGQDENKRIDVSISSYLRLLSGYLEFSSALKTLEYLIRRYKVHVYNAEDLILCSLPYHDTHVFVKIVQLIDTGNSRWKFLDGVRTSGARLPREVIVQQCIRDMGVLEAICDYATPAKKNQPSTQVTAFCTAVIFEVLGLVTVDSKIVKRIFPYVSSGLQVGARGKDQKAGALMIASLLSQKATLASSVVKSLLHLVADIARAEAKDRSDLLLLRMSFMTVINIVQASYSSILSQHDWLWSSLQSVELIPKKTVDAISDIRDVSEILSELTKDFNIDKFVNVFLDSLLEYSATDDSSHHTLLSVIRTVPIKDHVNHIVNRLLSKQIEVSKGNINLESPKSGSQGKQILVSICETYPDESRQAIFSLLKDTNMPSTKVNTTYDFLCKILDEHLDSSQEIPDPKVFLGLEHSEAEIRRSAVLGLDVANILREKTTSSKKFDAIQDTLIRRLYDDDLNVVLAVLELKNLPEILSSPLLVEALQHVLQRCIEILLSSSLTNTSLPSNIALLCLQQVMTTFKDKEQYAKTLATAIFPLLLIRPKTQKVNLKALEFAKDIGWPFYENVVIFQGPDKKLDLLHVSSINLENITKLAEAFSLNPEDYMPWLVQCCNSHEFSRTLFFLVVLLSLKMLKMVYTLAIGIDCCCLLIEGWAPFPFELAFGDEFYPCPLIMVLEHPGFACLDAMLVLAPCGDVSNKTAMVVLVNLSVLFDMSDVGRLSVTFDHCLSTLQNEWNMLESLGISTEQFNKRILDVDCKGILEDLLNTDVKDLNAEILGCLFMRFSEALIVTAPEDVTLDMEGKWAAMLQDIFMFFACHSKHTFKKQLEYLFTMSKTPLMQIMLKLFREEGVPYAAQIESLHSFSNICPQLDEGLALQLLADFPSVLVPLSSDSQNVRVAAMSCIEELFALWSRISSKGNKESWSQFLGELLSLIIQQKKMILSDRNVLASFFTSLLSSPSEGLLVQQAVGKRFDGSTKNEILNFMVSRALGLPAHAKLKILSLIKGVEGKLMSISGSCTRPTSSHEANDSGDFILKALQVNGSEEYAVQEPCLTILRTLSSSFYGDLKTEIQEAIFRNLLVLFRSANISLQNASRDALLRVNVDCSIFGRVLDSILNQRTWLVGLVHGKKQRRSAKHQDPCPYSNATQGRESTLSLLSAFLEVLLMKKDIDNRTSLVGPLFKLLNLLFMDEDWILKAVDQDKASKASFGAPQSVSDTVAYIQQTLLLTLEDISSSIGDDMMQKDIDCNFDLPLLVSCARSSSDAVTRNHVFSLITTLVKITPGKILEQILDILAAIGECTVTQWDTYSQRVFEGLISAIMPYWLSRTDETDQLLQIFVNILPQVAEHRRLSIIGHILRTLGEAQSLGSLLFLLFHSMTSRKNELYLLVNEQSFEDLAFIVCKQWEYEFALLLCEQYSCKIWLPSVILALQKVESDTLSEDTFIQILVAMQLVSVKLQDPDITYKFDSEEDLNGIQAMLGELMELVVRHLQLVDFKKKHIGVPASIKSELKDYIRSVLRTIAKGLLPSTYFNIITKLILHSDRNVRKKALGLLCETMKDLAVNEKVEKKGSMSSLRNLWLNLDVASLESFETLCLEILKLLDDQDDVLSTSLKLTAVSSLEVVANTFPSHYRVFSMCLGTVCRKICSDNSALSSHCLRATGALVNALGPKSLPELPNVMECVLRKFRDVTNVDVEIKRTVDGVKVKSNSVDSVFMCALLTLEAVVDKLAGFLNPYLGDILRLVLLHPLSFSISMPKLKSKADVVRLLLPPMLLMYSDAVQAGESSLSILFEMLGNLVSSMDKSSIGVHHAKVFDLCLLALDLRNQYPSSVQNVDVVEKTVISAIVKLTMKLTETMFRPLFIKTVEWSGLNLEGHENAPEKADSRTISFYNLVNKLAETHRSECLPLAFHRAVITFHIQWEFYISTKHRSLFVPYFKYLLDGCVRGLVDSDNAKPDATRKKKAKLQSNKKDTDGALSIQVWHIRSLILSSLHKCFLYDAGSSRFLDSSNFQILLKPLVSQLVVEPPVSIENYPNVPSVHEVDDLLVACVGQMAVVAGSDLLWKPLNHEVLMQTRSEKIRARILGLRIVKYLVENLKDEYLVFLEETIPFLSELLEDIELPVKTLAQEVLKEMESLSGESLREYL
ncbi:ARM repeat superfamily protein [Striga asiatica]|uniref:ARM repeat superfamily protein n=1 Tax=Striga asiatica TaxID=4170 RepID=A0A5A7QZQ1_STRAF|nr:ARM repeat superfamily protein [Striga asiatica]